MRGKQIEGLKKHCSRNALVCLLAKEPPPMNHKLEVIVRLIAIKNFKYLFHSYSCLGFYCLEFYYSFGFSSELQETVQPRFGLPKKAINVRILTLFVKYLRIMRKLQPNIIKFKLLSEGRVPNCPDIEIEFCKGPCFCFEWQGGRTQWTVPLKMPTILFLPSAYFSIFDKNTWQFSMLLFRPSTPTKILTNYQFFYFSF